MHCGAAMTDASQLGRKIQNGVGRNRKQSDGGFFFNDTATTEIYTLSLHDALPIYYFNHFLVNCYSVRGIGKMLTM